MRIIIDSRMRKIEKEYLSKFGELIEIVPQDSVYEEISGHPDIFFCKINGCLFRAPNLNMVCGIPGECGVGKKYPDDIKYNICQIGNLLVHNFNFTDKKIMKFIEKNKLEKVYVNQGYSNCSISVVTNNACITSDIGIYEALKIKDIDCILVKEDNIRLIDKYGHRTKMNGFIGGATCVIDDKFILFGDSDYLDNKEVLHNFLNKYNLQLVDFKGFEIFDYGGIITF